MALSTAIVRRVFLQRIEEPLKVGDILTVSLSENFSASKSQSAKSAKKGDIKI